MQTFADIPAVTKGVRRYLSYVETQMEDADAPLRMSQDTFDRLEALSDSPSTIDVMVNAGELLYARRNELDSAGRNFVHALMTLAWQGGFYDLRKDNRGIRIAQSMARDEGEQPPVGMAWPDPSTDPSAAPQFLAPVATPEAAAPPPPPSVPVTPAAE
jgi:hypothetical protein